MDEDSIQSFLRLRGFAPDKIEKLEQDASQKQHYRIQLVSGDFIIVLFYPCDPEIFNRFIAANKLLESHNISVPQVLSHSLEDKIVLMSDAGSASLNSLMDLEPQEQVQLYGKAVDCLFKMQSIPTSKLSNATNVCAKTFLLKQLSNSVNYLHECGHNSADVGISAWEEVLNRLSEQNPVIVHRDWHVDNLLWHQEEIVVTDFQDLAIGHYALDLAMLVWDIRREVGSELRKAVMQYYSSLSKIPFGTVQQDVQILGACELMRIIVLFIKKYQEEQRERYKKFYQIAAERLRELGGECDMPMLRSCIDFARYIN